MQIAFLERMPLTIGENVSQTLDLAFSVNSNDKTAVLKARTLLAYLWMTEQLEPEDVNDMWTVFSSSNHTKQSDKDVLGQMLPKELNSTDAVLPIKYMVPSWDQPGLIAVRNDSEVKAIFINTFLDSSRRWLLKKPTELNNLKQALTSQT